MKNQVHCNHVPLIQFMDYVLGAYACILQLSYTGLTLYDLLDTRGQHLGPLLCMYEKWSRLQPWEPLPLVCPLTHKHNISSPGLVIFLPSQLSFCVPYLCNWQSSFPLSWSTLTLPSLSLLCHFCSLLTQHLSNRPPRPPLYLWDRVFLYSLDWPWTCDLLPWPSMLYTTILNYCTLLLLPAQPHCLGSRQLRFPSDSQTQQCLLASLA